jgi:protein-disulfide isomerase
MQLVRIALALSLVAACSKGGADKEVIDRLDKIEKRIADIESKQSAVPDWVGERINKVELAVEGLTSKATRRRTPAKPRVVTTNTGPIYSIPVDESPGIGPENAKVVIVKAMEFACPACERARPFVESLVEEFAGQSVRIAFKHFIVHPSRATIPAQAACAAHRQGKYFQYEDKLWEGFNARKFNGAADDTDDVIELAGGLGMNMTEFKRDLEGHCKTYVQDEHSAMRKIGIRGTPTFYVNGRELSQRTVAKVKEMVEEELALADQRIADGTRASDYYETWVVGQGRKAK